MFISLAFYFNAEGAVLGKMIENQSIESSHAGPNISYRWFMATKLLPCGPYDAKLQRFTGNDDAGNPPAKDDHLTMAIHAFAHFSVMYSKGSLLLCDLQGMPSQSVCTQ